MKPKLIQENIYTIVHLQPNGIYMRVGKWYSRCGDAQRILAKWWCKKDYSVMSFNIEEGELIENRN